MTAGWNFERRRDTCARFLLGVAALAQGLAGRDTSLEAVRSRMRLDPEEALFAARRLHEDELLTFAPGGAVRSNARGIERAATLSRDVRAKAQRFDEVARALAAPGPARTLLTAVLRADAGALACGSPDADPDATYQLVLRDDGVALERRRADGTFAPVDPAAGSDDASGIGPR